MAGKPSSAQRSTGARGCSLGKVLTGGPPLLNGSRESVPGISCVGDTARSVLRRRRRLAFDKRRRRALCKSITGKPSNGRGNCNGQAEPSTPGPRYDHRASSNVPRRAAASSQLLLML